MSGNIAEQMLNLFPWGLELGPLISSLRQEVASFFSGPALFVSCKLFLKGGTVQTRRSVDRKKHRHSADEEE